MEAKLAIVRYLRECWPHSHTMTPRHVSASLSHRTFVQAAQELQDQGLIMYEMLLVGAGPEPMLLGAILTRKGQVWGAEQEAASGGSAPGGRYLGACCET